MIAIRARGRIAGAAFLGVLLLAAAALAQDQVELVGGDTIALSIPGGEGLDVYVDAFQVNAFVAFEDDGLTLTLPFPDAVEPFVVTVVDREAGVTVYVGTYQIALAQGDGMFDRSDFTWSFQDDAVWRASSRQKPPAENFRPSDVANDFRGNATWSASAGAWRASLEGELVGTDDDLRTLRPGANKIDVSRMLGTVHTQVGDINGSFSVGDVTVPGFTGLVNGGFASRGMSLAADYLNGRVRVSVGNAYGNDIVGTQRGIVGWDEDNRRTAADLSVTPYLSDMLTVTLSGSLLDAERPALANFNVAEVVDGERNTVYGGALQLGMWHNRITVVSEVAHSRYANPAELNSVNLLAGGTDIGATSDVAHSHRIDANVWRGELGSANLFAGYSRIDPLFRSVQAFAEADRETWQFGGGAVYDMLSASGSLVQIDSNVDDISRILGTRQQIAQASLDMALDRYRGGEEGGARRAIPSSIGIFGNQTLLESLNTDTVVATTGMSAGEAPDIRTLGYGIGASWGWDFGQTQLRYNRERVDTRQIGHTEEDVNRDHFEISQALYGDIWSASLRAAYGRTLAKDPQRGARTHRYEVGGTLGLRPSDLPDLSVSMDLSLNDTIYNIDRSTTLENYWRSDAVLDFSKFLPDVVADYQPYLTLSGMVTDFDQRDSLFGANSQYEYSVSMAAGLKF